MTLVFFIPILVALIMLMIVLHLVGYVSMFVNMDYFPTFYLCQLSKEIIDIHVPIRILNLLKIPLTESNFKQYVKGHQVVRNS